MAILDGNPRWQSSMAILDGNPRDSDLAVEMMMQHETLFGHPAEQAAFDGGFATKDNLAALKAMNIKDVMFSKSGLLLDFAGLATAEISHQYIEIEGYDDNSLRLLFGFDLGIALQVLSTGHKREP
jgi:hypothetical protein